jgi:anti-sigma regulatory factor (Ser/Thr protein kinase)
MPWGDHLGGGNPGLAMPISTLTGVDPLAKTTTEPEFRLSMPSRAENVAIVRQALGGAMDVLDLHESRQLDINAAVSEACNNVVVHAYRREEGPMEVYLCIGEDELEVVVFDEGVGIQPRYPDPDEELQGLGLSLIQTLSDRVEFLGGIGEGTTVRMAFELNGRPGNWTRQVLPDDPVVHPPPGELTVTVSAGALAAPVLGRVIAMLASRAGFSLEGVSEAQLVTDSLAAHVPRVLVGSRIMLGIDRPAGELIVRVGPLKGNGAERILEASALGDLPPVLERLTKDRRVEAFDTGELLRLTLVNPA